MKNYIGLIRTAHILKPGILQSGSKASPIKSLTFCVSDQWMGTNNV